MARPAHQEMLDQAVALLQRHVGDLSIAKGARKNGADADLVLQGDGRSFVLEWKSRDDGPIIVGAIAQLKRVAGKSIPIVAVPYMGEASRRMCADAAVSWIDLAGNADIRGPGLLIRLLDKPRPPRLGRPPDVFAPASSRLIRAFLMSGGRALSHGDLVERSGLDKARVSRLIPRLEAMGAIRRVAGKEARPQFVARRPSAVLKDWHHAYDFSRHSTRRGFILEEGRSAESVAMGLMRRISEALGSDHRHAFTGLAGAWLQAPFATHRLVTVMVEGDPSPDALRQLGFHEEDIGANVWLVRPNDPSVFAGASSVQDLPVAHPIQVYLDLKAQPERSAEAAEALVKEHLTFAWARGED